MPLDQAHRRCEAVVAIEQHRVDVRLHVRSGAGWTSEVLAHADDVLSIPTCGLTCTVADLYRGAPVALDEARP